MRSEQNLYYSIIVLSVNTHNNVTLLINDSNPNTVNKIIKIPIRATLTNQ